MAKKQTVNKGIFSRTEKARPADNSDLKTGRIKPMGVGLTEGEIAALDDIAQDLELARNALLRYAVHNFIIAYRAGQVDLSGLIVQPPPPKKRLKMS
jgi:hypothetical protein